MKTKKLKQINENEKIKTNKWKRKKNEKSVKNLNMEKCSGCSHKIENVFLHYLVFLRYKFYLKKIKILTC